MLRIELKSSVNKDIRKIPEVFLFKVNEAIKSLINDPTPKNSKKMRGYKDYYRLQVGVYRIIYRINKTIEIVFIVKIGHRKDVYRLF